MLEYGECLGLEYRRGVGMKLEMLYRDIFLRFPANSRLKFSGRRAEGFLDEDLHGLHLLCKKFTPMAT